MGRKQGKFIMWVLGLDAKMMSCIQGEERKGEKKCSSMGRALNFKERIRKSKGSDLIRERIKIVEEKWEE